jgi:mannose-6-phosphate isomerase-like protein (cupin superfamily)
VSRATAQTWGPGQGRNSAPAPGVELSLKSGAGDTHGGWSLFEYTAPARFAGPPLHSHKNVEEAFFVLDGTLRFEVDGETVDVEAGGYARVPPGVVHRFSNPTDTPTRFLGLCVPGGIEAYFDALNELMAAEPAWPPADMGPLLALMAKYDTFPPPAP